MSNAYR
jgi:hypothetical protein